MSSIFYYCKKCNSNHHDWNFHIQTFHKGLLDNPYLNITSIVTSLDGDPTDKPPFPGSNTRLFGPGDSLFEVEAYWLPITSIEDSLAKGIYERRRRLRSQGIEEKIIAKIAPWPMNYDHECRAAFYCETITKEYAQNQVDEFSKVNHSYENLSDDIDSDCCDDYDELVEAYGKNKGFWLYLLLMVAIFGFVFGVGVMELISRMK